VRARDGLTLIEVLIAVSILAVLMLSVSQGLLPLFRQTRRTQLEVQANQQAERVLEAIRTAWTAYDKYEKTCAPLTLPEGVTVSVRALDKNARPVADLRFFTDCAQASRDANPIPAKRVRVRYISGDRMQRVLTLDVPRPKP